MGYKKDLIEFKKFKSNYSFNQKKIIEKENKLYCDDILLKDENGYVSESTNWINIGYSLKGNYQKLLSNLFPYTFKFKGYKLSSIESFFQAIKFKEKSMQKKLFKYSGKEALVLKEASLYDWKKTKEIYFLGKKINRNSIEYSNLIDELYISAIQNKFYRNAIKKCNLPIIHVIGNDDINETVFTRYEFEFMLNCLHDFLNQ